MDSIWSLQLAGVHVRRLDDLMLAEPESPGGALAASRAPATFRLENISFRYGPTEPLVLDDVSLEFPAGACVAIVGPSGSGKSTLVKLILGIEKPQQGSIKLDGVPIDDVNRKAWRERFGTVMQDDTLLAGSINENIAFFDPRIDMDKVRAAAATPPSTTKSSPCPWTTERSWETWEYRFPEGNASAFSLPALYTVSRD